MLSFIFKSILFFCFLFSTTGLIAQSNPEGFIENKNQWEKNILFKSDIPFGNLFIEKQQLTFNYIQDSYVHGHNQTESKDIFKGHAFNVKFNGSNEPNAVVKNNPSSTVYNYFIGDKSQWASNVHSYESIELKELYRGISLRCISQNNGFKYEWIVAPKSNIGLIEMDFNGVDSVQIINRELYVYTSVVDYKEASPVAYQIINGEKKYVPCNFRKNGNVIGFTFPKGYDGSKELVIDPQLIFSTYTGSTADNWGNTATYDLDGNTYIGGVCFSYGYPTTIGAYQRIHNNIHVRTDLTDVAIMKLDKSGKAIYATYLGGTNTDVPSSIMVNSKNELIILGVTGSSQLGNTKFPTTPNAYQQLHKGGTSIEPLDGYEFSNGTDLFVTVLNATGSALIGSTYIGGSNNDGITDLFDPLTRNYGDQIRGEVYVDANDDIFIAHKTNSSDIVNLSKPGYDKTFNGGRVDGYIAKLNSDVSDLYWDSYFGGTQDDVAYSIQLSAIGEVYIAGGTLSTDLPISSNAIKPSMDFGDTDGYLARFSADGTKLLSSTYIGTNNYDQTFFVQLDTEDNVYTIGQTFGNYPMSSNVYGIPNAGQFIHKMDTTFSQTVVSTTFGSDPSLSVSKINMTINAFTVSKCGTIMLSGWGGEINQLYSNFVQGDTYNMPITSDAFQKTTDGSDFYLLVLEKDAYSLLYATYFGGYGSAEHVDGGTSRFDKNGIVYQSVCAGCGGNSLYPTTPNVQSNTNNSWNCNNAVFKFDLTQLKASFIVDKPKGCVSLDVTVTNTSNGGSGFEWHFGDGTVKFGYGPYTHTYTTPGDYTIELIALDPTTCIKKDTASIKISAYALPQNSLSIKDSSICKGDTIQLLTSCLAQLDYQWTPNIEVENALVCSSKFFPTQTRDYILIASDTNGCIQRDTVKIVVTDLVPGILWQNLTECQGKPKAMFWNNSTGEIVYNWTFGDGSSSTESAPIYEYNQGGQYPIVLDMLGPNCSLTDTLTIDIREIKIPNLITPNGDYKNDCFEVVGIYKGWNVDIYNAWSKRIFSSSDYQNDFCGERIDDSVYYYLICSPQGNCCKGWLHMINNSANE